MFHGHQDQKPLIYYWLTSFSVHSWQFNSDLVHFSQLLVSQHPLFIGSRNLKPVRTLKKCTLSENIIRKVQISETFYWTSTVMHWSKLMLESFMFRPQLTTLLPILIWKVNNLKINSKSKSSQSKTPNRLFYQLRWD